MLSHWADWFSAIAMVDAPSLSKVTWVAGALWPVPFGTLRLLVPQNRRLPKLIGAGHFVAWLLGL